MPIPFKKFDIKPWLEKPEIHQILSAITKNGKDARFIGGCVRDHILGIPNYDIDIATQELPQNVISFLNSAGIKTIPTGIKHGTITAIANDETYEITTLRQDIKTDGRHAKVNFTEDWQQDAARRDFTFNAMSVDMDGNTFDYFNGLQHINAKEIHFVGHAADRIKEDYLRILRYFRIMATLDMKPGDQNELKTCVDQANKLKELSGERVRAELFKILSSNINERTLKLMYKMGVLQIILPSARNPDKLSHLIHLETEIINLDSIKPDPIRRLAALVDPNVKNQNDIANSLKLSNREYKRLTTILDKKYNLSPDMTENEIRATIFKLGSAAMIDLTLLNWANQKNQFSTTKPATENEWKNIISVTNQLRGNEPSLPVRGQDIIDLGIQPGREFSQLLLKVEKWWLKGGCIAGRIDCLEKLKSLTAPRNE